MRPYLDRCDQESERTPATAGRWTTRSFKGNMKWRPWPPWRLCPARRRPGDPDITCDRIGAGGEEQPTRSWGAGLGDVWGREGEGWGRARWRGLAAARRSGGPVRKGTARWRRSGAALVGIHEELMKTGDCFLIEPSRPGFLQCQSRLLLGRWLCALYLEAITAPQFQGA
jgi:hypothetical protein